MAATSFQTEGQAMQKRYTRDGAPVRRTLVAEFTGPGYGAEREEDALNIYWEPEQGLDGEIRLVATFTGRAYVAEPEADGLKVFLLTSEPVSAATVGDGKCQVIGRPGWRTSAAMSRGTRMTGSKLQALNEAVRRGDPLPRVKDRRPNAQALKMQRANEALRKEWKR
jgi:hypothetical protein